MRRGEGEDGGPRRRVLCIILGYTGAALVPLLAGQRGLPAAAAAAAGPSSSCLACHSGIEDMHPKKRLRCEECHGGNPAAEEKERAHVVPRRPLPNDERIVPPGWDPDVIRFRNPMDLRVAKDTCGVCHPDEVDRVPLSLHGTTSGHLGDGLYENGVVRERHPRVAIFGVTDPRFDEATAPPGAVRSLQRIPPFRSSSRRNDIATHFSDVPRKNCMNCHLWSRGRAVRGRLGMDGDYRGDGCAACHVRYEDDGISRSEDPTVSRVEAGHPAKHAMQRVPDTATCTRCHYGDASIGLTFRGLAQPVPGMPQSPDAAGLSRKRLNGVFHLEDPAVNPPDVHHARGMQCADCHTGSDTMGDGHLYTRMEDAVEIGCETCHGSPAARATGLTERGRPMRGLEVLPEGVRLVSRSDGRVRRVKQARDVVDPNHPDFNPRAALAMTEEHAGLRCYACHTGWNPNFFGFHFDRNEGFTQLDVVEGTRTEGRVNTQEKVFATFKQLYLGRDSHGAVAPYMVGFSTMATVHAADGTLILDQEMPVTAAGLSGMTMIHHQPHATTPRARDCVECHRAPSALGMGSVNFRLGREILLLAGDRGIQPAGFDRRNPGNTKLLGQLGTEAVRAIDLRCDDLQGRALTAFAALADGSLVSVDARNPLDLRVLGTLPGAAPAARAVLVADDLVYVADGRRGVVVIDASFPARMREVAVLPLEGGEARGLHLDGFTLWIAAGPAGLVAADVGDPAAPAVLSRLHLGDPELPDDARSVSVLFQHSRPSPAGHGAPRLPARALAAVANGVRGFALVDVTRPEAPRLLAPPGVFGGGLDAALGTVFEIGSEGGGIPSRERDLAFLLTPQALVLLDVSDTAGGPPPEPRVFGVRGGREVRLLRAYNAPFLQTYALVAAAAGLTLVDVTRPSAPAAAGNVAQPGTAALAIEEFPLDRMVDSRGRPLKDVSHEGARYLDLEELRRVLEAPVRGR
ncbi:MAG: hypothetical protein L6R43_15710 [Planctomycetes bacterium]|nr:hypothetical protein [Planctomycetota bacterium]